MVKSITMTSDEFTEASLELMKNIMNDKKYDLKSITKFCQMFIDKYYFEKN